MGADRGIHIEIAQKDYENLAPLHVAKIFAKLAKDEDINLILLGKQVRLSAYHLHADHTVTKHQVCSKVSRKLVYSLL